MGLMQILVQLGVNATAYQTGLKQAQGAAQNFGNQVQSQLGNRLAGLFTLGAIEEGLRRTIKWGGNLTDLSARTGIAMDDLQKFEFAAGQTGVGLDKVIRGNERLTMAMAKARAGNKDAIKDLQLMGMTMEQMRTLDAAEAFRVVGDHVKNVSEVTGELQQAMRNTMGRQALELLQLFRADVRGMGDELERLGLIVTDEQLEKLDALDDRFAKLGVEVKSFFADVISFADFAFNGVAVGAAGLIEGIRAVFQRDQFTSIFTAFREGFTGVTDAALVEEERALDDRFAKTQKRLKEMRQFDEDLEAKLKKKEEKEKADTKALEEAAKIRQKTLDIQRRTALADLPEKARLLELERELEEARMEREAAHGSLTPAGILDFEKADLRVAELEEETAKLERDIERKDKEKKKDVKEITLKPATDQLTSIGNILGVDPNRPVVDKLEVVHLDLVKLISKVSGDTPLSQADSEFPT